MVEGRDKATYNSSKEEEEAQDRQVLNSINQYIDMFKLYSKFL